ncbi:hypothetical protein [Allohahella marinimesophila]|uniref:Polysaccharide lyase-like protein n=1 Tax=Allohahella marinimesophila TaxID=1054972 RepID=A0ABP7Q924_9GAMM
MQKFSSLLLMPLALFVSGCATAETTPETHILDPDWTFQDDFEAAPDKSFWQPARQVFFNSSCAGGTRSGSGTLRYDYLPNYGTANDPGVSEVGDSWAETKFILPIKATQIQISYDLYIPPDYVAAKRNHKGLMLWSGKYGVINSNITVHHSLWGTTASAKGGATPGFNIGMDGKNFGHAMRSDKALLWENHSGKWQRMHHYVELAERPGDFGRADIWRNGELIHSTHSAEIRPAYTGAPAPSESIRYASRGNYIDKGYLLGWANDLNNTELMSFCIENFTIKANKIVGATTTSVPSAIVQPRPPASVRID